MGVTFVIGRAGSGKTARCFRQIVEALRQDPLGEPIYWILPRQATFLAERELTCASGLGGFCRVRVLSFDELGNEVLGECGGGAVPQVTQLGRQMILGHLLRKHASSLRFFDKVAHHPGLAVKLAATLAEFDRCGKDPAQLEGLLKELGDGDDPFGAKLHDLQLIYKAYTDYLGQERLDPRRRMDQVLRCIGESPRLRTATVYADGFAEFDEFERRMLAKLGKTCRRMEITLLMDPASPVLRNIDQRPDEMSLFHRLEEVYRRLTKALADEAAAVERPILLPEVYRFRSAALGTIEREMFPQARAADVPAEGIQLVEAPDRRAEVDHAARQIKELLRGGMRLRQIAVLVRRLELYHDLINAAFREHGIRFFVDRRRTMAHHPLLQFVRAVLMIAQHHWPHDAVMMLIKSGLGGLTAREADQLENYVLEHRLRGLVWAREEPWAWRRNMTRSGHEEEQGNVDESGVAEELRKKVRDRLSGFIAASGGTSARSVREIVLSLYDVFQRFGLSQTLGTWIEQARTRQEHEQAGEHEQAWKDLIGLLDQMVDLLGQEPVTLADFQDILESALETFDLALTPPTVDEVLVGQVDRTRTPNVKAVLLLGMNDGVFPYAPRDASVLSDSERIELQKHQFNVEPGSQRRLLDESLLGYIAFTRASERLYVSRSLADDAGRPLGPSAYWTTLRRMFPAVEPINLPRDERGEADLIGTPRQLLTALMRWVRTGGDNAAGAWPALYQWVATHPADDGPVDSLRYRTWKALTYDNAASLDEANALGLLPRPLKAGVWQIEMYATCPFRHFLRYGLRLEKRDEAESEAIDLEQVLHRLLENLTQDMLRRQADWASLTSGQARDLVLEYVRQVGKDLRGEMMLSNARNRYLLGRIERALEQVIVHQQAMAQRGRFRPAFAKVQFGEGTLPPLVVTTPKGQEIHLHGRIDRVDVINETGAAAALDYRLYGGELSLWKVYHGLSLQLLVCLSVLEAHGEKLAGKKLQPAAAFYVRLLRQLEKVDHPSDAPEPTDPKFPLRGKPRGIFDGAYFRDLDSDPDSANSDVIAARLKKDGTFGYKGTTDVAETEELLALLRHARQQLARLGDEILAGKIDIAPYRLGTTTPCSSCPYRGVCRFDPAINRYHHIRGMKREDVLKIVTEEGGHE